MYIKRNIFNNIIEQLENDLVIILIGARQVGKTVILKLLQNYVDENNSQDKVLYFDLEKPDTLFNFSDYKRIVDFLEAQGVTKKKKNYVLLDEFQKMPTPTKTLKILHDHYPHIKIIATGSSSLDIFKKLRDETMAGRKRVFNVYPLDFREFLSFNDEKKLSEIFSRLLLKNIDPETVASDFVPAFEKFALFGGYPRISSLDSDEEKKISISEIYESYVNKDIAGILGLEDSIVFNKLVSILATQTGNLFNQTETAKILGLSRFLIEKYLFVLENTFIIKFLSSYHTNKHKEIVKMPKIYFIDTGLRNFSMQNFNFLELRQDAGAVIENAVFLELIKNIPPLCCLHFWRSAQGAEVDFLLIKDNEPMPIEVKYRSFEKPIVPSGLRAFIHRYNPRKAVVLTKDFSEKTKFEKCEVDFLPVYLAQKIFSII
ncbi:MAG: ATP-binding protein [bacterium]